MLNYSNIMATIAVFLALGGSSYAAVTLSRDSVRSKHIAKGQVKRSDIAPSAVSSDRVKDGSLLAKDFQPGQLPSGTGASGVVKVLDFQAQFSPASLPGNFGNTIVTPNAYRTSAHIAGTGEAAVIAFSGMGSPSVNVNDVMYINAMISTNGSIFKEANDEANQLDMAESLSDGTAHVGIDQRVQLDAGKTYVFGAGFASNNAVTINPGYCYGVVTIVRT
jgi:hypothetical protein